MAVRIRMKKLGRRHRPFFRICAVDGRAPRDGKVIEELGTYDPMVSETDARVVLKRERVDYWLSVGAQPSEKVDVLIKKYGTDGTHREHQEKALERLAVRKPSAPPPVAVPTPKKEEEPAAAESKTTPAESTPESATPESATPESATPESAPEKTSPEASAEAGGESGGEAAPADTGDAAEEKSDA